MRREFGQADFLGWLGMLLAALAVIFAATVLTAASLRGPISGDSHVDQSGTSDPGALPSPQTARPTPASPKSDKSPPPAEMPVPAEAPAAAGSSGR